MGNINSTKTGNEIEKDQIQKNEVINHKIQELVALIKKYFDRVDDIDEKTENKIIKDIIKYEENMMLNSRGQEDWLCIDIIKDE